MPGGEIAPLEAPSGLCKRSVFVKCLEEEDNNSSETRNGRRWVLGFYGQIFRVV